MLLSLHYNDKAKVRIIINNPNNIKKIMKRVELNVKDFGLQGAIAKALNAEKVEVLVSMATSLIPFRCDWLVSNKQIKGIADVVANVDGVKMMFKYI